ncbi:hypothetical protein [Nocardia sp. NPDC058497]|uniref:hypothetical protein n=1 Tax=Nocardia sp. NPDC058497 TaxID=3346529 RepID=UPI0036643B06
MKSQTVVAALAVIGVIAVVFTAYRGAVTVMSEQVVLGCSEQRSILHCVYHRTTPGLLSTEYQIVVGTSPNRGLIYDVPYPAHDTRTSWDADTGLLTIAMPGTALTITEAEYVDTR